jgi:hypothetical protein
VVAVLTAVVLGTWAAVAGALERSSASRTINTSFLERHHLTDRHRNARKSRKTYRFSKDWRMHEAMTYLTKYSYNFCWPVRTLRERTGSGAWRKLTPAMAAGLADHVWSLEEWLTFPAIQRSRGSGFKLESSSASNTRSCSSRASLRTKGKPRLWSS